MGNTEFRMVVTAGGGQREVTKECKGGANNIWQCFISYGVVGRPVFVLFFFR